VYSILTYFSICSFPHIVTMAGSLMFRSPSVVIFILEATYVDYNFLIKQAIRYPYQAWKDPQRDIAFLLCWLPQIFLLYGRFWSLLIYLLDLGSERREAWWDGHKWCSCRSSEFPAQVPDSCPLIWPDAQAHCFYYGW
jgi:hypothetical protein